jgi:diguanylate cyclase (GGDEF)-like protein
MDNFKFFNDAYGHVAGDTVLNLVATNLRACCRGYDVVARFGGDEFAVLMPDADQLLVQDFPRRVRKVMETSGFRPEGYDAHIPLGVSIGLASYPAEVDSRQDLLELADSRLRRAKLGSDEESFGDRLRTIYSGAMSGFKILDALVTAVDNRDRYSRRHSEDVVQYATMIAREMGFDDRTIDDIQLTALLHDLGKIGIPDQILRKPGPLEDEEYEIIQQHAAMGAMIVSSVAGFACTLGGMRHHHERWDGLGYPDKLKADEIPIIARVLAVADSFSAMTTNRPYRVGMPASRALDILRAGSGSQWEPRVVEAFLSAYLRQGSELLAA